jgi:hypothetical protein
VLESLTIEKEGENKFFGFGICQKLSMALIGADVPLAITKNHDIKVAFGVKGEYLVPYPTFKAQDIQKDSETDEIALVAYDALYRATEDKVSDLNITAPYTVREFATACASYLGVTFATNVTDNSFNTSYPEGANFEGTETLRSALNAIAEVTQTIYYINNKNELYFKRLDKAGEPVWTIKRDSYISLKNGAPCVLSRICHATELGDNIISNPAISFATGETIKINGVEGIVQTKLRNKNLIPYPYFNVNRTTNGIKYTINSDGSITANGTATANASFYLTQKLRLPAGTYTLSSIKLTQNNELRGAVYNADGTLHRYLSDQTFTIDEEKTVDIYLVILSGNTVNNVTYKPMLVEGAVVSDYIPYLTDFSGVTVTANGTSYTPTVEGIVDMPTAPEVSITTDNTGILIDVEYYTQGFTQYVRDNPFWDLREDVAILVENAVAATGGLIIDPFECEWFGNHLLEIGDKIKLITRNGATINSYLLSDSITYNGALSEATSWAYEDNEAETASNPTSLGEALNQTFARVDKANKEIQIQAGKVDGNTSAIAALQINTESISASVTKVEENIKTANEATNEELANIKQELNLKATAEEVTLEITKINTTLKNGVEKVHNSSTGYKFDENGLSISKKGNAVNTLITNDGMRVFRQGETEAVLTANNDGVNAENLHATTYLKIGVNSRFEDYNNKTRTGCFWIGS